MRIWRGGFDRFHGRPISTGIVRDTVAVESDSCSTGMGVVSRGDWLFVDWEAELPEIANLHINYKEAAAVVLATRKWAHSWENKLVVFYIDNQAAMHMLNKCSTADKTMMQLLREMFWWSVEFNFTFKAVYLEGKHNLLADTVSRLIRGSLLLQWALLSQVAKGPSLDEFTLSLHQHMPDASLRLLLPQIQGLGDWRRS